MATNEHDPAVIAEQDAALASLRASHAPLDVGALVQGTDPLCDGGDQKAIKEQQATADGSLAESARQNAHKRDEKWKDHFAKAFVWSFWIFWVLFCLMVVTLVLHWILPNKCHWLTAEQLDTIKTIIAAALASKVVSSQREKIGDDSSKDGSDPS